MFDSLKNQFLISLPTLTGDYFHQSISLLIDHNEDGAFGLMVNRLLEPRLQDLLPELEGKFDCPLLEGGPVAREMLFFLHGNGPEFDSTTQISADMSLTTSPDILDAMKTNLFNVPIVAILGYAGWGAGQLESELAENIWLLVPADADIVFDTPYDQRAQIAAARFGIDVNLVGPKAGHD